MFQSPFPPLYFTADDDDLKAEAEAEANADVLDGFPPTFTEKPMILPNDTGTLVTMRFKVHLRRPEDQVQFYNFWFSDSSKTYCRNAMV